MNLLIRRGVLVALLQTLCWAGVASAQNPGDYFFYGLDDTGVGNWGDGDAWEAFRIPSLVDQRVVIGSPDSLDELTVVVEANVVSNLTSTPSPSIVVGLGNDGDLGRGNGTLNIQSGGTLVTANTIDDGNPQTEDTTGDLTIGDFDGTGTVTVAGGGTLNLAGAINMPTNNNVPALLSIDGTSSTATVSAASAFLDRQLEIKGSQANVSIAGNLTLGLAGVHTWQIPAAGASKIVVGGNADLGGTLKLVFPNGTPTPGTTWDLIESATVDDGETIPSSFSSVDQSSIGGLQAGQRFAVTSVDSGSNTVLSRLVLEQHPTLTVDRNTGEAWLVNPGSAATVDFDLYVIRSAQGLLVPGNFDPIAPTDGWVNSNPTEFALSELQPTASANIAAATSIPLGSVFDRPEPRFFGDKNEDIRLQFAKPGGDFIEADVTYTGDANYTLTLKVDPLTGDAEIVNATPFTVTLDTYSVKSATASLLSGDANWSSLDDRGVESGTWVESNSGNGSTNLIAELNIGNGSVLAPGATLDLGAPFDTSGVKDLEFLFTILPEGDFNADGRVDLGDYNVWRDNLGAADDSPLHNNGDGAAGVTAGDYAVWKANFGRQGVDDFLQGEVAYISTILSGNLTTQSVPEPTTSTLLVVGLGVVVAGCRRRRR